MSSKIILFLDNSIDTPSISCHAVLAKHIKSVWGMDLHYHHLPSLGISKELSGITPAAIISLGSASNVGDGSIWHNPLIQYLESSLKKSIAVLGICFTHQIMAHHWGATVAPVTEDFQNQEGSRKVSWPKGSHSTWIISHTYQVINPPIQLETLAATAKIPHEILRHTTLPYWSIQAHPEASLEFVELLDIKPSPPETQQAMKDGVFFIDMFLQEVAKLVKIS
jgi:GMP synthase-like glutamine amidotransferase